MMKRPMMIAVVLVGLGLATAISPAYPQAKPTRVWSLVEVLDEDGRIRAQEADRKHAGAWSHHVAYARDSVRGSARLKLTYIGPTDDNRRPPHVKGANFTLESTWNSPPPTLAGGEIVRLRVTGKVATRSHGWPIPQLNLSAQIVSQTPAGRYESQVRALRPVDPGQPMQLGAGTDFRPVDTAVTAAMPAGSKDGQRYGIKFSASSGNLVASATYVYVWGPKPATRP